MELRHCQQHELCLVDIRCCNVLTPIDIQDVCIDVALFKIVPNKICYTCILPGSGNTASTLPIVSTKSIAYKKQQQFSSIN